MDTSFQIAGDPVTLLETLFPIESGIMSFGRAGRSKTASSHAALFTGPVEIIEYLMEGFVPYLISAEKLSDGIRLIVRKTGTNRDEYVDLSVAKYLSSKGVLFSKSDA